MSIQTIIRTLVAVTGLSLALAGASWAEESAANDGEKDSVEAAPPADADESATDQGEASDSGTDDDAKD